LFFLAALVLSLSAAAGAHPPMKNLGGSFVIKDEEWYICDKSPRPNVNVPAHVDESSYSPDTKIKMGGDDPVVGTNEHVKARNICIFMGHRLEYFQNPALAALFTNSIFWAAHQ